MDAVRVLFVCTGNICRSPLAEGMLRERFRSLGIAGEVSSTGLRFTDRPATDEAVRVAARRGVDIAGHRSRILAADQLDADLILCMEREHVREVVLQDREAFTRTFTLPEIVRLGREAGRREPEQTLVHWLKEASGGRRIVDFASISGADEVADPYGRSLGDYEWCAAEISDLVDELVDLIWPATEQRGPDHAARAG